MLDDFWTAQLGYMAERGEVTEDDLVALRETAFDLHRGLAEVQPLANEVRLMLEYDLKEEEVEQVLDLLAGLSSQPELPALWREALPDYSFRGAAISACTYIADHAAEEANGIQIKLGQLEHGPLPLGDFHLPLRCAVVLLIAAGAVVGAVAGAGAVVASGASGLVLVLAYVSAGGWTVSSAAAAGAAWTTEQCPGALRAIGGAR
jgi:hypothetical protein